MQLVDLNLATRQFKNETLPWVVFLLGVTLVGSVSWWNVSTYVGTRTEMAVLLEREASIERRLSDLRARQTRTFAEIDRTGLDSVLRRTDKANEVIRWKSFSWTRLFNVLQEVQPNDVQMLSITPVFHADLQARRRSGIDPELVPISVEGLCKDVFDFFDFQGNLLLDPRIDSVEPDRWATDERSRETEFTMRFLYDPRIDVNAAEESTPDEASVAADRTPDVPAESGEAAVLAQAEGQGTSEVQLPVGQSATSIAAGDSLASGPQNKIRRPNRGKRNRDGTRPSPLPAGTLEGAPKIVEPFGQALEGRQDSPAIGTDGSEDGGES